MPTDAAPLLRRVTPDTLQADRHDPVDADTLDGARAIVNAVRARPSALREYAEKFGDIPVGAPLVVGRDEMQAALDGLAPEDADVLRRTADRIRRFARAQRENLHRTLVELPGGHAGAEIAPVLAAGCYAPGGRFPLPSSVLMTAVTAREAGVRDVTVASPKPAIVTLAAAAVAGADRMLCAGGAHAIAALAFGCDAEGVPACDAVVGPGNRWVTAAKQLVAGRVAIDMLAGPSELVIIADDGADPALIAADLLAQAEHDTDAYPVLITTSNELAAKVDLALADQLATLPSPATAITAIGNGCCVIVPDLAAAAAAANRIAPEHLQLLVADPDRLIPKLEHFGALIVGAGAGEVRGDYGAGPNHVLPTGGTARSTGGLSVLTFLRVRTWLRMHGATEPGLVSDAVRLARMEGLEAHARAAERRAGPAF
jgi:phosphoribosyl-ATP pyrophosphohydrolase/phosphoribosyl-AMP cyclohydrolase/histidinol dehydrogenase